MSEISSNQLVLDLEVQLSVESPTWTREMIACHLRSIADEIEGGWDGSDSSDLSWTVDIKWNPKLAESKDESTPEPVEWNGLLVTLETIQYYYLDYIDKELAWDEPEFDAVRALEAIRAKRDSLVSSLGDCPYEWHLSIDWDDFVVMSESDEDNEDDDQ